MYVCSASAPSKRCTSNMFSIVKPEKRSDSEIYEFVDDLTQFARHNRVLMEECPSQLYASGLIFAPSASLVRRKYANEALKVVQSMPRTRSQWDRSFFYRIGEKDTGGSIHAVALSGRVNLLALASDNMTIKIWDLIAAEKLQVIRGFEFPISDIAFSKACQIHYLASLSDRVIKIWDVRTGDHVCTLSNQQGYKAMIWMNEEPCLRAISCDCLVEYWTPESEKPHGLVRSGNWKEHGTSLVFSQDTMKFATWSAVDPIHVWDVEEEEDTSIRELISLNEFGESWLYALSYDGSVLAASKRTIQIYDTSSGIKLFSFEGHLMQIRTIAFASNSRLLASGSNDGTIKIWSLESGQCLQNLKGHRLPVLCLAFSDESDIIVSGSQDGTVAIWDASHPLKNERGEPQPEEKSPDRVTALTMTDDGQMVAVGFQYSKIHLYDRRKGEDSQILDGYHQDQITDIHFLKKGNALVSASLDGTVRLWDTVSFQHSKLFELYPTAIQSLVFSDNQEMLAVILTDFTISTWVVTDGTLPTLIGHTGYLESAIFLEPDKILASSSRDCSIRIWNIEDGKCLKLLQGHENWVKGLAFTKGSNFLASASLDKTVKLWNVSNGQCLETFPHAYEVECVAFSNDHQILASFYGKLLISLWAINSKTHLKALAGRTRRQLKFDTSDRYLLTDGGSLKLDLGMVESTGWKPSERPESTIYFNGSWITRGTEAILWVPPRFRTSKFLMVCGDTVVLVDTSGEVLPIRFR